MGKLTDLQIQRKNANKHTPRGLGALEQSIQQDGWIGAITVAADGETFDGSARIEVGAATGFDEAIVVESDGSRPVIVKRTDIPNTDDPRAIRLGVAANRVAQLDLSWDPSVIASLGEEGVDLSGLFFPHEMAALLEQAGTEILDANELWRGMPEFQQEDKSGWKALIVHFENEQDYQAFAQLINQTLTKQMKSIWYPYKAREDLTQYRVEDESEVPGLPPD